MKYYILLHHSATKKSTTNLDAIRRHHKKKFGRTFYNIMISIHGVHIEHDKWNWRGKGKRSMDICVIGDFTKEKPTDQQLRHLSEEIKKLNEKHDFESTLLHSEARRSGLWGKPSVCPGNLGDYMENYSKNKENNLLSLIEEIYDKVGKLKEMVHK